MEEDEVLHEIEPLLQPIAPTYLHFRVGRETRNPNICTRFVMFGFKIFFCLFGLWGHQAWNYIPRIVFSVICLYQAVFRIVSHSSYLLVCAVNGTEETIPKDYFKTGQILYDATSVAACISYVVFIGSLIAAKRKDSALVSPSQSMVDVHTDIYVLFIAFVCMLTYFSPFMILYVISENNSFMTTGVVVVILAHWASASTCHVFAISSLALGTFAQDTFRLIQNIQNGSLDDVIRIHEHLCLVVFNTVSAYSTWFVLHWFTYGASALLAAIFISEEVTWKVPAWCISFHVSGIAIFFLLLFLLPCIYAAKITGRCSEICDKINRTTSADWNEGHPFRDRRNISMFISYAKDRRCGFKVGRITFNTSLAWFSFFFGLTALMFHFF